MAKLRSAARYCWITASEIESREPRVESRAGEPRAEPEILAVMVPSEALKAE
eukprot:COSAG04_NODE_440_length_14411_cov_40.575112_11_plen_52_part_00